MPVVGERKAVLIVILIVSSLMVTFLCIGSVKTIDDWSEVTRFSGLSAQGGGVTTEPFTCDHIDWRIRWEFYPGHFHFPDLHTFSVTTYPQGEDTFYVDSIFETGDGYKNGTSYIHNNSGIFYMKISTGIVIGYTIIVEQNIVYPRVSFMDYSPTVLNSNFDWDSS